MSYSIEVLSEHLCHSHDWLETGLHDVLTPKSEIATCLSHVLTVSKGFEDVSRLISDASFEIGLDDLLKDFLLFFGSVFWIFQNSLSPIFQDIGMLFHFPSTGLIDALVDMFDEMASIVNSWSLR
ncbi:MAG: hypothetical protein OXE77_11220 [Flavobacteriaceae bacterium]|nr:hypothetical protein [Flavobacteriaceae bacterium]MCY4268390.1 hypothetical protein [Flavobacteriaceae bacterium]